MSIYFKYHVASGQIVSLITTIEESDLLVHQETGYEFSEGPETLYDTHYVTQGGAYETRSRLSLRGNIVRHAALGEPIEIRGFPSDTWVSLSGSTPVKSANGVVTVQRNEKTSIELEVVGKYVSNNMIKLNWAPLAEIKEKFRDMVDTDAEASRGKVITQGSGQAMTYLRKADAARLFLANSPISDAQQARLDDEAARLGVTVEQAANSLVLLADQWESIDAAIDNLRLTSKLAISEATTGKQIGDLYRAIVWPI